MKRNFIVLLLLLAFVLSAVSLAFSQTKAAPANNQTNLAAQLPASDAVVVMDMQRLMKEALPQVLSGKVQVLNEINTHIEQVKNQVGIDLRQFEQVAVGVTIKQAAPGKFDFEPIVIARGQLNPLELLTTAKGVAKGNVREEKAGAKTLYVFAVREILQANKPAAGNVKSEEEFNQMLNRVPAEVAVTTLDANTLVIGLPGRVRETVEKRTRIGADILALAARHPGSLVSFGGNVPAGMSKIWGLEGNDLGKTLDSIRQLAGGMNMTSGNAQVSLIAKTAQPAEAKNLHETLSGLQEIGAGLLGGMKGEDKKVYARLAQNAKIALAGSEVTLYVAIPQSGIATLLGKK